MAGSKDGRSGIGTGLSRRNILRGIATTGVASLLTQTAAADGDGDVRKVDQEYTWGVKREIDFGTVFTQQGPQDNDYLNLFAKSSLSLVNGTYEPYGNPDPDDDEPGAWRYTFSLNISGKSIKDVNEPGQVDSPQRFEEPVQESFFVATVQGGFSGGEFPPSDGDPQDSVAVSARRDRDYLAFVDGDNWIDEVVDEMDIDSSEDLAEMMVQTSGNESDATKYLNQTQIIDDGAAREEASRRRQLNGVVNGGIGIGGTMLGMLSASATPAGIGTVVVGLGAALSIYGTTMAIDDILEYFEGQEPELSIWEGFEHKRPSEAKSPVALSYATFDVYVSPDESVDILVGAEMDGTDFYADDIEMLKTGWSVGLDAPPAPEEGDEPDLNETVSVNWDKSKFDTDPDVDDPDISSSPQPVLTYPVDIRPDDTVRFDAEQTKPGTVPVFDGGHNAFKFKLEKATNEAWVQIKETSWQSDPYMDVNFDDYEKGIYKMKLWVKDKNGNEAYTVDDSIEVGDIAAPKARVYHEKETTPEGNVKVTFHAGQTSEIEDVLWHLYLGDDCSDSVLDPDACNQQGYRLSTIPGVYPIDNEIATITFTENGEFEALFQATNEGTTEIKEIPLSITGAVEQNSVDLPLKYDFEEGESALDQFEELHIGDPEYIESFHVTDEPAQGEHALEHATGSHLLEPDATSSLEPPLTVTFDIYIDGSSGLDVLLQYDRENEVGYKIDVRRNAGRDVFKLSKESGILTSDTTVEKEDRTSSAGYDLQSWETITVTWSDDGELTARVESAGTELSIKDDELSGHPFVLKGFNDGGSAAVDNIEITEGVGRDQPEAELPLTYDFEEGESALDQLTQVEAGGNGDHAEPFQITSEPAQGDYALWHKTDAREVKPDPQVTLEPPLSMTVDVYMDGEAGVDLLLQYDRESDTVYKVDIRRNEARDIFKLSKESDFFSGNTSQEKQERTSSAGYSMRTWETITITWDTDGTITARVESSGTELSIQDTELSGYPLSLRAFRDTGAAAVDNIEITEGVSTDQPTAELPLKYDFEEGESALDQFEVIRQDIGNSHEESFHITPEPAQGDYALGHATDKRKLLPVSELSLEPPLTLTMDIYIEGGAGLDLLLQYDQENNVGYKIDVRRNLGRHIVKVSKETGILTDNTSLEKEERTDNAGFSEGTWETITVTWSADGTLTARVESSGTELSIQDDELSGHSFAFNAFHDGGFAAVDNIQITDTGGSSTDTGDSSTDTGDSLIGTGGSSGDNGGTVSSNTGANLDDGTGSDNFGNADWDDANTPLNGDLFSEQFDIERYENIFPDLMEQIYRTKRR